MSAPRTLDEALRSMEGRLVAAWRRRFGGKGDGLSAAELDKVGAALLRLQRGLTGGRGLIGADYMEDRDLLGAYLLYYWPLSFAQAWGCLGLARAAPMHALDCGSGPGPVAAALAARGAKRVFLADKSPAALALAVELLEGLVPELGSVALDMEAPGAAEALAGEAARADCVAFGHALNELWPGAADRVERRAGLVAALAGADRLLLAFEPALLTTSRDLLALRDALLARGYGVAAPCLWKGPCPALAKSPDATCHATFDWEVPPLQRELARRAGLDRGAAKASFFAAHLARRGDIADDVGREAAGAARDRAGRVGDGKVADGRVVDGRATDEGAGASGGRLVGRVVSEGLLNKAGRLRYMICGPAGRLSLSGKPGALGGNEAAFRALGRMDLVEAAGLEARGEGYGLLPGSTLIVEK